MTGHKILFSNMGYARGISGELAHHMRYAYRHLYCSPAVQKGALRLLGDLVAQADPDICCFVEIDGGSFTSAGYNQLLDLAGEKYPHHDIENKYAPGSHLRRFFITKGKSSAFISKNAFGFEKIYFRHGTKRLVYKIALAENLTLFFAHLSLNRKIRAKQIVEIHELMSKEKTETVFVGDFNTLTGLNELAPLVDDKRFVLLNDAKEPTFTFHKRKLVLDLCVCSKGLVDKVKLTIVPQPFSDHAALLVEVKY